MGQERPTGFCLLILWKDTKIQNGFKENLAMNRPYISVRALACGLFLLLTVLGPARIQSGHPGHHTDTGGGLVPEQK